MKKILLITGSMCIAFFLFVWLSQSHFTAASAIPWDIEILSSKKTKNGKAILFEDKDEQSFGVALVERKLGFLYQYYIGTNGHQLDSNKPFQASGLIDNNHFVVGINTAVDSNIKYIAIGNHLEEIAPSESYSITINDVKAHKDEYHWKEVKNHYVFFVIDEYTEDTWTIRGFDEDGNLVADKLFGSDERYVHSIDK